MGDNQQQQFILACTSSPASRLQQVIIAAVICTALTGMMSVSVYAGSQGMSGYSGMDPMRSCAACHKGGAESLRIGFHGPAEVKPDSETEYTLALHSRGYPLAGFNLAASAGQLNSTNQSARLQNSELLHHKPYPADPSGITHITFKWQAPRRPGMYFFHVHGVAADGDTTPLGDNPAYAKYSITVTDPDVPNSPPIASIRLPTVANVGKPVLISGAPSTDTDGKIIAYHWKFGDGEQQDSTRTSVRHTFQKPGVYPVELVVKDNAGETGYTMALIEIITPHENIPEEKQVVKAHIQAPISSLLGTRVVFDATQTKPSSKTAEIVDYVWNYGDGTTGHGKVVSHTYSEPGVYYITLTARDSSGRIDTTSTVVTVSSDPVAVLHGVNSPKKIKLTTSHDIQFNIITLVASVPELRDGISRCGTAYLERNGTAYLNQPICFTSPAPVGISFEYPFSRDDAPVVNWSAYVVMDSGFTTQHKTDASRIEIDSELP